MVRNNRFWQWDPLADAFNVQQELGRLFGRNPVSAANGTPAVDVWRGEQGIVLTTELPGLDIESLDVTVHGDIVTLKGTRQAEVLGEGAKYHRQERATGAFTRSLQLPYRVDPQRTEARYEQGVLTVVLPQVEEEKPKKVTVKAV